MVHIIISSLILAAIAVISVSALVLSVRRIIAQLKGDEAHINQLRSYGECEILAAKYYDVDSQLFAKYWEEVKKQKGISAVPYDALELAEWEYNVINNK